MINLATGKQLVLFCLWVSLCVPKALARQWHIYNFLKLHVEYKEPCWIWYVRRSSGIASKLVTHLLKAFLPPFILCLDVLICLGKGSVNEWLPQSSSAPSRKMEKPGSGDVHLKTVGDSLSRTSGGCGHLHSVVARLNYQCKPSAKSPIRVWDCSYKYAETSFSPETDILVQQNYLHNYLIPSSLILKLCFIWIHIFKVSVFSLCIFSKPQIFSVSAYDYLVEALGCGS